MDLIASIAESRKKNLAAMLRSMPHLPGSSERVYGNALLKELNTVSNFYSSGWYAPPPNGICVLFGDKPYTRLQFETIRAEAFWPKDEYTFQQETVGILYSSPVDKETGMIGDAGLTIYTGDDKNIQAHIKNVYEGVLEAAEPAQVGGRFNDLYTEALEIFKRRDLIIGWMTTEHDPLKGANLGHTIPGSYGIPLDRGDGTFDATKEAIRSGRIYINPTDTFTIPETCAFTFEARLTDTSLSQPNSFFHVIVAFSEGRRQILTNFDDIFKSIRMTYML